MRNHSQLLTPWLLGVAVTALAGLAFGQTPTASLTGLVKDQSGAVIPGVRLVIVNVGTGVQTTTQTNGAGYYSFPLLPPGSYRLTLQKAGFKTVVRSGITLSVQQAARLDFTIQVGATRQQVTVSGAPPLLQNETSSISELIGSRQIANLPMLGRNVYALVQLIPGVFTSTSYNNLPVDFISQTYVSVNGGQGYQNSYLLDGMNNTSSWNSGPVVYPIPDDVAEYRVTTNNYDAAYGRAAGGVFNVVTKTGTNEFHGDAYDYLRNNVLDANDFFSNLAGLPIAPFRFNQFGGTFGGPIRKNRTFFFVSYEGVREVQGVTYVATVPTAAQRQGDFSQTFNAQGKLIQIFNPFSTTPNPSNPNQFIRSAFSGDVIPSSTIDPVAAKLLRMFPPPDTPGNAVTHVDNFTSSAPQVIRKDDFSVRVDEQLTDRHHLFGEFLYDQTPWDRPNVYGNVASPVYGPQLFGRRLAIIGDTYSFTPSFLGSFEYGFARQINFRTPLSQGFNLEQVGFPANFARALSPEAIPEMTISGFTGDFSLSNEGAGQSMGSDTFDTLREGMDSHTWQAALTKIAGRHTVEFGGGFSLYRTNILLGNQMAGKFTFSPGFTLGPNPTVASASSGYSLASFLLGTAASGDTISKAALALQSLYYDFYVQDSFKVSPKLTLNFGLRYEYQSPRTDRFNQLSFFSFQAVPPVTAPGLNLHGGLGFVGVDGNPRGESNPVRDNFAPRVGFAYSLTPKTVLRGGAGIFYAPNFPANSSNDTSGYSATATFVGSLNGVTPFNVLSNPFPQGVIAPPGSSQGLATLLGQSVNAWVRNVQTPASYSWNFDVQRQLPAKFMLSTAYVGSRAVHLFGGTQYNQLPDADLAQGNSLLDLVTNPFYGQIASGPLSKPTVAREQLLLPFPQFLGMTSPYGTWGSSEYNALQITLERQFSHGFSLTASYAWSKLMDNGTGDFQSANLGGTGIQDFNNLRAEWSVSELDTPQRFVTGYVWELPVGTGREYFNRGWMGQVLGGWQVNGITTFATGHVLGISSSANTTFSEGGGQRPDWTGVNPALSHPTRTDWFNTQVFTQPAPFTFGNSPRTVGSLRADSTRDFDFSIIKDTTLREHVTLQFRTEFFNLFNTVQFGIPDTSFGTPNFGVVSSQLNQPRIIQFALKFLF